MDCPFCGSQVSPSAVTCPVCGAQLAAPTSHLLPAGSRLQNGRYSIGKLLGQGGFGITYQGADISLKRSVAVKELFPDGSSRRDSTLVPPNSLKTDGFSQARSRFLEEAQILAQFTHPGIVKVFDVFEENHTAYLIMEFLQGQTLGNRIAKLGQLDPHEVLQIAHKVLAALQTVHQAGLLHRDIKPDNLFLTHDQRVVLIDFGSARNFASNQTMSHTRLITPGYAPLEQYATAAKFGPYTDIYALAASLYHCLTGESPPSANDRLLGSDLKPLPPNTPPQLAAAIHAGMQLKASDRPQQVDVLMQYLTGQTPTSLPSPPPDHPPNQEPGGNKVRSLLRSRVLTGHSNWVTCLAYRPSGSLLASGSLDTTIRLWNLTSGRPEKELKGHTDYVSGLSISQSGNLLYSVGKDGQLGIWKLPDGENVALARCSRGWLYGVASSPINEGLVAFVGDDQRLGVVNLINGSDPIVRSDHAATLYCVVYSPDGSLLAIGGSDGDISLWETHQYRLVGKLAGHGNFVRSVSFSPDGHYLISASRDRSVKLWDIQRQREITSLNDHGQYIFTTDFDPRGDFFVSGGADGRAIVYAPARPRDRHFLSGHVGSVLVCKISPDGSILATGGADHDIIIWSIKRD